jgi:hypothetical protein
MTEKMADFAEALAVLQAEQGWNEQSLLGLALNFITQKELGEEFITHLKQQAEFERAA